MAQHLRAEFPKPVSDSRFVDLLPSVLLPLVASLQTQIGRCTGVRLIESTPLAVCHNARIQPHRVCAAAAARGKMSLGGFSGCKRHLVGIAHGERLACGLTRGTVDDRQPVPTLLQRLTGRVGKLWGDRGAISQLLVERLLDERRIQLITRGRTPMHNRVLTLSDTLLLRQRALIETLDDHLQTSCQIEHTRHRRPVTFLVHLVCGHIADCHLPNKRSLGLDRHPDVLALPGA
jgi:hypothetical protein